MRVLGSTDELLVTDLVLRRGASVLGLSGDPSALAECARRWRPWRSYAGMHLWRAGAGAAMSGRISPRRRLIASNERARFPVAGS